MIVALAGLGSCTLSSSTPLRSAGAAPLPARSASRARLDPSSAPIALTAKIMADLANVSPATVAGDPGVPVTTPLLADMAGAPAQPFHATAASSWVARGRAQVCLATALYYEADSESDDGERAVAQVVLNRVRHPAFPASVCGVVYQGSETPGHCQFTFACDGSMLRRRISAAGWARASRIAATALSGAVFAPVGLAVNYHTVWVAPRWSPLLTPAAVIGAHVFYRLKGAAGAPPAFGQAYARQEPEPGPHVQLATSVTPPSDAAATILSRFSAGTPLAPAPVAASSAEKPRPPITADDQILPQWRDSGKWIAR